VNTVGMMCKAVNKAGTMDTARADGVAEAEEEAAADAAVDGVADAAEMEEASGNRA